MAGSYVNAPSYPTPNWDNFGQQVGDLGSLPEQNRLAQLREAQLQAAQLQLQQQQKQQAAFAGGLPMDASGQPDYAKIMQTLAQTGDTSSIPALGRLSLEQQQYAPAPADQFLGGGGAAAAPSGYVQGTKGSVIDQGVEAQYIAEAAKARGIDPDVALRVAKSEGLAQYEGDAGSSFGPFQLHYGGVAGGGNAVPGLGDTFTRQTGLDARNPSTWRKQVDFALDTAAKEGWGAWHGWKGPERAGLPGGERTQVASLGANDATPRPPSANLAGGSTYPPATNGSGPSAGQGQLTEGASGSVASLAQGLTPNQQASVAKALRAPSVDAPLNPEQTAKLQTLIQKNPALKAATQQTAQAGAAGQVGPSGTAGAGGGQPLVYQPKLDPGFKTQEEEIEAEKQQIAKLSASPSKFAQQRAAVLEADRQERLKAIAPVERRPGQMDVDPRTGKVIFQGQYPGSGLTSQAIEGAADTFLKTGKLPPNMGRGVQGKEESNAIMNRVYEKGAEQGLTPGDIAERQQSFGAMAAGKRLLSNRVVGLELVGNEAQKLIPVLEKTIDQLGNGQYSDINAAINNLKKRSGNEDLIRLGVSAESLKSVYARVLKAGGTPTEGAAKKADDLFSGAWSKGQMRTALDQMKIELKNAKESVHDTMKEFKLTTGDFGDELKAAKAETGDQGAQGGGAPIAPGTKLDGGFVYKGPR